MGEEGNHVVPGFRARSRRSAPTSKVTSRALAQIVFAASLGITPSSASASAGVRLDLEPDLEARLRLPDGGHFRAGFV